MFTNDLDLKRISESEERYCYVSKENRVERSDDVATFLNYRPYSRTYPVKLLYQSSSMSQCDRALQYVMAEPAN